MLRVEKLIGRRVNTARVKMKLRAVCCAGSGGIPQSPQPFLAKDWKGYPRLHLHSELQSIRRRRIIILAAFIIFGFILFSKFASAQVINCCHHSLTEPFCAEVENVNPCPSQYPFKKTATRCSACAECACRGSVAPPDVSYVAPNPSTPTTPSFPGQLEQPETPVVVPTQEVPVPGLTFTSKIEFCSSNPDLTDMSQCPAGDRVFVIPWLGQYIIAIYKWALRAIIILAIFMIMLGGVQWIVSRGSPAGIMSAKSKISSSIIAVVIILSVNLILSLINPQLTILKPITIGRIATIELGGEKSEPNDSIVVPSTSEVLKQCDSRWGKMAYTTGKSGCTLCSSGCGATSLAMVLDSYGKSKTPATVGEYAIKIGARVDCGGGTNITKLTNSASYWGMKGETLNLDEALNVLATNKPLIFSIKNYPVGGKTRFAGGHFMVATAINGNNVSIKDSSSANITNLTIDELKKYCTTGNFFYIHP